MLYFIESTCIIAVNVFMLINGYFMCDKYTRNFAKPIKLIIQVSLFSLLTYSINVLTNQSIFSAKGVLVSLVPVNYFVILYIVIYVISPFINIMLNSMNIVQLKKLLIVLISVFSIWPTMIDCLSEITGREWLGLSSIGLYGSQWGYSVINFAMLYIVGAYLKRVNNKSISNIKLFGAFVANVLIITIWALFNNNFSLRGERSAWEYCNPLLIVNAVLIFLLFKNIKIRLNGIINTISKETFSVYLLHAYFLQFFDIEAAVIKHPIFLLTHILTVSILLYAFCWIIGFLFDLVFNKASGLIKVRKKKLVFNILIESEKK